MIRYTGWSRPRACLSGWAWIYEAWNDGGIYRGLRIVGFNVIQRKEVD